MICAPSAGEPIRLLLTGRREGCELWAVLREVHAAGERLVSIRAAGWPAGADWPV